MLYLWFKKEFWGYFRTPIAYVLIVAFQALAAITTFFLDRLLDTNQADLRGFFETLPWLLLAVVPGLSMRMWAEERSTRSLELTMTLPLPLWQPVVAKFLAGWGVLGVSLLATLPMPMTLFYLGDPDLGALACGYAGGFLMAGSFLAIGSFFSVVSKNQMVCFNLTCLGLLFFILLGWGLLSELLSGFLTEETVNMIATFGVIPHYQGLGRGVVDGRDLFYFLTLMGLGLGLTLLILALRGLDHPLESLRGHLSRHRVKALGLSLAYLLGGVLIYQFPPRVDLTDAKVYSLSAQSLALAEKVPEKTHVYMFFSRSLPNMPPFIRRYADRVEEVLNQYVAASGGKLVLRVIYPEPDTEQEEEAIRYGIEGVSVRDGTMYLGIAFERGDKKSTIEFLDPASEGTLEYQITKALADFDHKPKRPVALYSSLKLYYDVYEEDQWIKHDWEFVRKLKERYDVIRLSDEKFAIPEEVKTLIVLHPRGISKDAVKGIDSHLARGGQLFLAIDPFSRVQLMEEYGSSVIAPGGTLPQMASHIPDLLDLWGVQYDITSVVGDGNRATGVNTNRGRAFYPYQIQLTKDDLGSFAITERLRQMVLAEPGAFDLKLDVGLKAEVLLETTKDSGIGKSFTLAFQNVDQATQKFKPQDKKRVLALMLEGVFPRAFENKEKSLGELVNPLQKSRVVLISDVDFLSDIHATDAKTFGDKDVKQEKNDNIAFFINSIDYLEGSEELVALRRSAVIARPFTRYKEMQKETEKVWRMKEQEIRAEINDLKNKLNQIYARDRRDNRLPLVKEDLLLIKEARRQEHLKEAQFHGIRKNLREAFEGLQYRLIAANFLVVPFLIFIFAQSFFYLRRRKEGRKLRLFKKIWYAPLFAAVAALIAIVVYQENQVITFSAKTDLMSIFDVEKLALVKKVSLARGDEKITLLKGERAKWRLGSQGQKEINADRLARLLYDLAELRIVRKVSGSDRRWAAMGFDQGVELHLMGDQGFEFHMVFGRPSDHGGYYVKLAGKEDVFLLDGRVPLKTTADYWTSL